MMLNQGVQHESVYLEERTRLLLETVRAQRATIERQQERIDRLEREFVAVPEQVPDRQPSPVGQKQGRRVWTSVLDWLTGR